MSAKNLAKAAIGVFKKLAEPSAQLAVTVISQLLDELEERLDEDEKAAKDENKLNLALAKQYFVVSDDNPNPPYARLLPPGGHPIRDGLRAMAAEITRLELAVAMRHTILPHPSLETQPTHDHSRNAPLGTTD